MKIELFFPEKRGWPELILAGENYDDRTKLQAMADDINGENGVPHVFGETDDQILCCQSPCVDFDKPQNILRIAIHCVQGHYDTTMPNDCASLATLNKVLKDSDLVRNVMK